MQILITVAAFVIIFSLLILVHEFGHFWFAKRAGVRVEEFGMGLPPRIWGKKIGETLYSLNWIPFGGFVRLFGEDAHEAKFLKNKHSFASKNWAQRFWIVFAGVFMNFLLALVLLTAGYIAGIKPLIFDAGDLYQHVRSGNIQLQPGMVVKTVQPDSWAAEIGLLSGDVVYSINGQLFSFERLSYFIENHNEKADFVFWRPEVGFFQASWNVDDREPGFDYHQMAALPRLYLNKVLPGSIAAEMGLKSGDVILQVNGEDVFLLDDFQKSLANSAAYQFTVWREAEIFSFTGTRQFSNVVVSGIQPGSVAEKAGFTVGDIVTGVADEKVLALPKISALREENAGKKGVVYVVERAGKSELVTVDVPEDGLVGLYLTSVVDAAQQLGLAVFQSTQVTSLTEIKDVKYPFYEAPYRAWQELKRLTEVSLGGLKRLFVQAVFSGTVPEDIGGPVRIAQMTHGFVQEGFWALVRFTALLSMSLAVINLVPIPALDGGRLLFLVIELFRGKPVNRRFEAIAHTVGFFLLIGLILLVTYNDIVRIVAG